MKYYIKQHPEKQFKLVPDAKFERQYFGIAVAKGNSELLGKINAGLQKIVADGTYAKIYKTLVRRQRADAASAIIHLFQ